MTQGTDTSVLKQGEKIDCYIPYCTSNFEAQGGSDATLFFFYVH